MSSRQPTIFIIPEAEAAADPHFDAKCIAAGWLPAEPDRPGCRRYIEQRLPRPDPAPAPAPEQRLPFVL